MGLNHKCKATKCGHLMAALALLEYHHAQWVWWESIDAWAELGSRHRAQLAWA